MMSYHYSDKLVNVVDFVIDRGYINHTPQNIGFIYGNIQVKPTKNATVDFVELNISGYDPINVYHPKAYICLYRNNYKDS